MSNFKIQMGLDPLPPLAALMRTDYWCLCVVNQLYQ